MDKRRLSFDDAVQRLNSKKLESLLEVSSLLSTLELYGGDESPVFPLLNNERCRLFSDAIVSSKAAKYKSDVLTENDLTYVMNVVNALVDPRLSSEVVSGRPREEMLYKLLKFFSRMANIQFRQQEFRPVGRILGLLEVLPKRDILLFTEESRSAVSKFAHDLSTTLGASLLDLYTIYLLLGHWYNRANDIVWKEVRLSPFTSNHKVTNKVELQSKILLGLFACIPKVRRFLPF
jgi:hypothetical protein